MNWNLKQIFENDEKAIENAKMCVEKLEQLIEKLEMTNNTSELLKIIKELEDYSDEFSNSAQYAWMKYSVNTDKPESQKIIGMIQSLSSKLEEVFAMMEVRIAQLNEDELEILKNSTDIYKHLIENVEKRKPHMLSKDAERVLAITSVSRREAISKIHSRLESSYMFEMEIDGKKKSLSVEEMKALRRSSNSILRKKAMETLLKRFNEDSIVLTEIYNLIVKDYDTESALRNYPSPISMMNQQNEVEDNVVENLIQVTNENVHILRKYYRWKSQRLGEELTLADLYAPVTSKVMKFSFEEAKEIILDAYYKFNQRAGDIVKSFFDEERIDLYPKPGKVSGAYCIYSSTKLPAYVLTNFNGDMYDLMTLAHELGHGLHGTLSKKQTYFNYGTPLTLAELASVFGEFLVFDYLKTLLTDEDKVALLASKIEDTFATTFRQNMFTNFEIKAHDLVSAFGFADWNELNEIYNEVLINTFDNDIKIPEWYKYEWSMVSHFFETPFYVYAYNFAHCLVISLYKKYLEEGKEFSERYLSLLESGGSLSTNDLLSKVGIDISGKEFWEDSFKLINNLVEELTENMQTKK